MSLQGVSVNAKTFANNTYQAKHVSIKGKKKLPELLQDTAMQKLTQLVCSDLLHPRQRQLLKTLN